MTEISRLVWRYESVQIDDMYGAFRSHLTSILLAMLFTASAALLGFAHRAPSAEDEAIAVAALSGKDVSDICAGQAGDIHVFTHCFACHIGDAPDVPHPVALVIDAELRFVAKVVAPRESRAVRTIRDPAHGLRAPPTV